MVDSRLVIPKREFRRHFIEFVVPYSTSKRYLMYGRDPYMMGSLARLNTNHEYTDSRIRGLLEYLGVKLPSCNPFMIPLAQLIEVVILATRAIELLHEAKPTRVRTKLRLKAGMGECLIEVPRGLLYHKYGINEHGRVTEVDIITPTVQNKADIEESVRTTLTTIMKMKENLSTKDLKELCEFVVRCYDPCISCSVHLVTL